MIKPHQKKTEYQRRLFAMRQVRDCVAGSDTIKRGGVMYAPMPSAMQNYTTPTAITNGQVNSLVDNALSITYAPWYHTNPAYSAYIHRAKFPDITANTLRGLVGVATRREPEVELPPTLEYLEDVATLTGNTLEELFKDVVSEIFQVGRHALVLDVREDNTFYIAQYCSESYINWQEKVIGGVRVQTYAEFEEHVTDDDGEKHIVSLVYSLEADADHPNSPLVCCSYKYEDGTLLPPGRVVLTVQGKPLTRLPVFNVGSEKNSPAPDCLPLLGIADCALDVYRHSADLNQAHFMTCNPTLIFIGVDADTSPKVVGSSVGICLSSPDSDAKYLQTDTSALSHVKDYIAAVFDEAVGYGAQLLGPAKRAAESAEALALRQSATGATLVSVVTACSGAINEVLQYAAELIGAAEPEFEANTEFAELALSAQDITALMGVWMSGGMSHLSFLENMAAAGRTGDRSAEEELVQIELEGPAPTPQTKPVSNDGKELPPTDGKKKPQQNPGGNES